MSVDGGFGLTLPVIPILFVLEFRVMRLVSLYSLLEVGDGIVARGTGRISVGVGIGRGKGSSGSRSANTLVGIVEDGTKVIEFDRVHDGNIIPIDTTDVAGGKDVVIPLLQDLDQVLLELRDLNTSTPIDVNESVDLGRRKGEKVFDPSSSLVFKGLHQEIVIFEVEDIRVEALEGSLTLGGTGPWGRRRGRSGRGHGRGRTNKSINSQILSDLRLLI